MYNGINASGMIYISICVIMTKSTIRDARTRPEIVDRASESTKLAIVPIKTSHAVSNAIMQDLSPIKA